MKLSYPSLILLAASILLTGCASDTNLNNEQYQLFVYQNPAANQYVYTDRKGVSVAHIAPQSKYYQLIQKTIDYSIRTGTPVCLRYGSSYATKILNVCSKEDAQSILKNIKVYAE